MVAVGIVDDLEAVEIEKQQGEAALAVLTLLDALLQPVGKQQPVRQPGQAVMERQLEQLVVGLMQEVESLAAWASSMESTKAMANTARVTMMTTVASHWVLRPV